MSNEDDVYEVPVSTEGPTGQYTIILRGAGLDALGAKAASMVLSTAATIAAVDEGEGESLLRDLHIHFVFGDEETCLQIVRKGEAPAINKKCLH
jgi:hypothetical protein